MSGGKETPYEVLGISPSASPTEIKKAFQAAARASHPDSLHGASASALAAAETRFNAVHNAWRVLNDPAARKELDCSLEVENARTVITHTTLTLDDVTSIEPEAATSSADTASAASNDADSVCLSLVLTAPCRCGAPLAWKTAELLSGADSGHRACGACSQASRFDAGKDELEELLAAYDAPDEDEEEDNGGNA